MEHSLSLRVLEIKVRANLFSTENQSMTTNIDLNVQMLLSLLGNDFLRSQIHLIQTQSTQKLVPIMKVN